MPLGILKQASYELSLGIMEACAGRFNMILAPFAGGLGACCVGYPLGGGAARAEPAASTSGTPGVRGRARRVSDQTRSRGTRDEARSHSRSKLSDQHIR